jgi:hypothetical protein
LGGSPAVQELLNKKDLTIEDLLDEEGLSLEVKANNSKLFQLKIIIFHFLNIQLIYQGEL